MALKIENVLEAKFKHGNTTYTMIEAKYHGVVVWPTSTEWTYIISNVVKHYTKYSSYIGAAGDTDPTDFLYFTGDVEIKRNGAHYDTRYGAYLTPSVTGGLFYANTATVGGVVISVIRAGSLGTTETNDYTYGHVYVSYATSSPLDEGNAAWQEKNIVTSTVYGEKISGQSYIVPGSETGYMAILIANAYTSSSNPCPASGTGINPVSLTAESRHTATMRTPWTQDVTRTYTSGSQGTTTETGNDDVSTTVNDPINITGNAEGFNRSDLSVSIDNRGTITGNARQVTYTLTNNGVTASVTLYQEANAMTSTSRTRTVAFSYAGTIPNNGGTYTVNYSFYDQQHYTSLSTLDVAVQADVTGTYCTPSVNSVNSNTSGSFTVNVGANTGGQRNLIVVLKNHSDGGDTISVSKLQEGGAASVEANIFPSVNNISGELRVKLAITSGSVTWPVHVSGVTLINHVSGGSTSTINAGDLTFSQPYGTATASTASYRTYLLGSGNIYVQTSPQPSTDSEISEFTTSLVAYDIQGSGPGPIPDL